MTLTVDNNGSEMVYLKELDGNGLMIYFCDPFSRGCLAKT